MDIHGCVCMCIVVTLDLNLHGYQEDTKQHVAVSALISLLSFYMRATSPIFPNLFVFLDSAKYQIGD